MSITSQQIDVLRAPFTPQAVKFRLDAKEAYNGKLRCVVYIDASLAADRLSAVDPEWSSTYTVIGSAAEHSPVLCSLRVLGVTRQGVGQYAHGKADDKHMKSAFSDALKRAAVEFGVGAYLRGMPQFHVTEGAAYQSKGKWAGIKDAGLVQLRRQYEGFIKDQHLVARFGEAIDHGDVVRAVSEVETDAMLEAADAVPLTTEQAAILDAIMSACGYPGRDTADKLSEDFPVLARAAVDFAVKQKVVDVADAQDVYERAIDLDVDAVVGLLGTAVAA